MKLYHYTLNKNIKSIFQEGLKPNGSGIVYLCPSYEVASSVIAAGEYDTIIEVETGGLKLTAFDDCRDWEVLCWTSEPILPGQLTLVIPRSAGENETSNRDTEL